MNSENLLTTQQAAEYLNVSPALLERSRWCGSPAIPFIKLGKRVVRYRLRDLQEYIDSKIRRLTTDRR